LIRLYFVLLLIFLLVFVLRWIQRQPSEELANLFRKLGWVVLISAFVVLVALGKLNWLIGLLGIFLAFLGRLIPALLRYAPILQRVWFMFVSSRKGGADPKARRNNSNSMTVEQAYQVLGLKLGCTEKEIVQAHKRLMIKVHPDKGGSNFLAAQLNRAKSVLLDK
jgi:hypothetical protein